MPFTAIRLSGLLALLFFINLSGCNYFQGSQADADADLAGLEDEDTKELDADSKRDSSQSEGELELKLKVGDRFPLSKRVEQRLTQADGQGVSVYRSLTEMLLSLSVEEIRDGKKLLSVRYHRVRYGHDIAGKKVEYASDSPPQTIPPEALAYAGLHENGFSFWIGPDNRVVELVGFAEFLQRCVRNVPPQHRPAVLAQLEGTHNENDLANFITQRCSTGLTGTQDRHSFFAQVLLERIHQGAFSGTVKTFKNQEWHARNLSRLEAACHAIPREQSISKRGMTL